MFLTRYQSMIRKEIGPALGIPPALQHSHAYIVGLSTMYLPDLRIDHPRWIDMICVGRPLRLDMAVSVNDTHVYLNDLYRVDRHVYKSIDEYMMSVPPYKQMIYDGTHIWMTPDAKTIQDDRRVYARMDDDPYDIYLMHSMGYDIVMESSTDRMHIRVPWSDHMNTKGIKRLMQDIADAEYKEELWESYTNEQQVILAAHGVYWGSLESIDAYIIYGYEHLFLSSR